uniref:Uncharacterized protein n=1 Tax=Timema cristinae TaxID=61476 RepID=A0A7R9D5F5_TIMCR|nr:unnamed protein product [Timema cristinae]
MPHGPAPLVPVIVPPPVIGRPPPPSMSGTSTPSRGNSIQSQGNNVGRPKEGQQGVGPTGGTGFLPPLKNSQNWGINGNRCENSPLECNKGGCMVEATVIHGFCCGCAKSQDRVPFACPATVPCPEDLDELCLTYEDMMNCCCY